jgi:integrase
MGKVKKFVGVHPQSKGTFRINYRDGDRNRVFETVEVDTAEEAAAIRQTRIGDVAKGLPVSSKPNTVLFEELAADVINDYIVNGYASMSDQDARLRLHLLPVFGKRKAAKLTTADFRWYIVHRMEQGAKAGTINRELELARHSYALAAQCTPPKIFVKPHIPKLEENNVRKGFFERDQFNALCRHLQKHLIPVATFGYITGWRHEDVMDLRVRHVHFQAGEIRLEPGETKTGAGRTFPMAKHNNIGDELRDILITAITKKIVKEKNKDGVLEERVRPRHAFPDDHVFLGPTGVRINRFDKAWATACKKAGLPVRYVEKRRLMDRSDPSKGKVVVLYRNGKKRGQPIMTCRAAVYFHDFRRTAYRNLIRIGTPKTVAAAAVGWTDPRTPDRYDIVAKADMDVLRERRMAAAGATSGANSTENETKIQES